MPTPIESAASVASSWNMLHVGQLPDQSEPHHNIQTRPTTIASVPAGIIIEEQYEVLGKLSIHQQWHLGHLSKQ